MLVRIRSNSMGKHVTIEVDDVNVIDMDFNDSTKVITIKTVTDFVSEYNISYKELFTLLNKEVK